MICIMHDNIRMMKSRRIRWTSNIAHMKKMHIETHGSIILN